MIQISEPQNPKTQIGFFQHSLWQLAFRSFFLLSGLSALVNMLVWLAVLNGLISYRFEGISPMLWHAHEMIFGFAATVAVGFILTAVQTWTGTPSIKGLPVVLMCTIWLGARLGFMLNSTESIYIAFLLQLFWWLLAIGFYARIVLTAKNKRNYLFIPLLSIMALLNVFLLGASVLHNEAIALHLAKSLVLMFTVLITVVGGRIIPLFTFRGANTKEISPMRWLEKLLLPLTLTAALVFIASFFFDINGVIATLLATTGALHVLRLSGWRGGQTAKIPLLWSLHISYLFMALGLIALSISYVSSAITASNALHMITVGAMGLMIFAMMSRVSLGHTGRMLKVKPTITVVFLLTVVATLARVFLPQLQMPLFGWNISGVLWSVACLLFLLVYVPILSKPRVD